MATETVAPVPPIPTTDDEQVEKKVSEEKKADEECSVPLTKESGEEILKTDDSICLETPAVDHEKVEPVVEAEKMVDVPVSSIPVVDETKVGNDPIPDILEQVLEAEKNADAAESTESVVREAPKEPAIEIIEEGQVEQTKTVDAPQSSYEAVEKTEEPLQVTTDKELVETVLTEIKESETESLEVQKPEPAATEVEEKPGEPCEVTQEVETKLEEVGLEKSVQDETVKDEGSAAANMVEPIAFSEERKSETEQPKVEEEETTHDGVEPEKCLEDDIVKDEGSSANKVEASTIPEGQTDKDYESSQVKTPEEVLLNGYRADYSQPDATEAIASQDQKKEVTGVDVVEKIQEEAAVEIEKVGGEVLGARETEKDIVVSTETIKEEDKDGVNGTEAVEKPAEEASVKLVTVEENVETLEIEEKEKSNVATKESVKLETVGEEKVETLEIEDKEKSNVVMEESTQPIELDEKKELSGLDAVEKLTEEAAVEVKKVGEKNVEAEDEKSVITEDTIQPILEYEKKHSSDADMIETSIDETEVGEENVVKIAETKESENKDEIIKDSSQPILVDQKKESNGVEKLAEDAIVESEKVGEAIETKNVQSEDSDSKTLEEVLTQQDKADANSYTITPSEVIEKSFEEAGKDVEPVAETEKEEHIKVETPGTVETKKENNVEEKQDEVTTLVTEPHGESKPSEPEVLKGDEPVTLEKTTEDVAKSDRNVELPAKDGDDTKPSEDLPKEVPAKTSQTQSNTILSKVKHTLVKAKRVITGKSPSSKNPASETKDDIKVK